MTVNAEQLEALLRIAEGLWQNMDDEPDKPADKLWWESWRCLKDSLYDLHGAWSSMALREREEVK